ncbi:MAG: hypothetical protein KAS19_02130 [Anaerolineales bacterium]|nr:hypothetical protein [Anaerolineales bacterium]
MNRDIVNQLNLKLSITTPVSANGEQIGISLDTIDDELGVMFTVSILGYTDGDYQLLIQDSDDNGATDAWAQVPDDTLIIPGDTIVSGNTLEAAAKQGTFSTKRYVRPVVQCTNVSTGVALLNVDIISKSEYKPD